jgi:hypothetical protein
MVAMYNYRPFGVASSINKPLSIRGYDKSRGSSKKLVYYSIDLFVSEVKGVLRYPSRRVRH